MPVSARGSVKGLSPRGRGKRSIRGGCDKRCGSIPAWAGETHCRLKACRKS